MTITEYLRLASKLRRQVARCEKKYHDAFFAATSAPNVLGGDGVPTGKNSGHNSIERKLVAEADAAREYKKASKVYRDYMDQLWSDIYNLRYWEGMLIERVYITNPILMQDDPFYRVEEILNTKDRKKMQRKLSEAERHLVEIMRARGIGIDNTDRTEQETGRQAPDNIRNGEGSGNSVS